MLDGSEKYTLPNCEVEVEVYYTLQGSEISFDYAEINGFELDCDCSSVTIDITETWELVKRSKTISYRSWFQSKLEHDIEKILEYHNVTVKSDYDEHFNQRAFI